MGPNQVQQDRLRLPAGGPRVDDGSGFRATSVATSREGVPKDLEARLHLAWLRSQLNSAAKFSGGAEAGRATSTDQVQPSPYVPADRSQDRTGGEPRVAPERVPSAGSHQGLRAHAEETTGGALRVGGAVGEAQLGVGRARETGGSLRQAGGMEEGGGRGGFAHRNTTELTQTLEDLWGKIRAPPVPVSSESTDESHVSAPSDANNEDELLAYDMFQTPEDVEADLEIEEEDLFKGLEDLTGAFEELEKLLPEGPAGLEGPVLEACQYTGPVETVSNSQNLTAEQLAFLQEFIEDSGQDKSTQARSREGPWNGIPPPATAEPSVLVKNPLSAGNGASLRGAHKRRSPAREQDEAESRGPEGSGRLAVPRTNSAQAGGQAATRAGISDAAAARSTGLNPIELLVGVAQAIVRGDQEHARKQLEELHDVASIYGDAAQRLSAYFLEGLTARLSGAMPKDHTALIQPVDYKPPDCAHHVLEAFQVLVTASPYLTFGQVSVNCAILEAFYGASRVHIVDYGIGHGLQWPPLLQALAARPGGAPRVRMTAIDLPAHGPRRSYCVVMTGERLTEVAGQFGVPFEYEAIASSLEKVKPEQIDVREGEVLAVHCALRLSQLLDETVTPSNPRSAVLRTIRVLKPDICTIVEQHTNHNSPFFLARFYEALYYYAGLFDAIGASVPEDVPERRVFEQQVLGKAIVNVLACEGQNRVERQETLGQWQTRIRRAGFMAKPLSDNVRGIVLELLNTYRKGYGLETHDEGSLILSWQSLPLLAMSAWQCDPAFG